VQKSSCRSCSLAVLVSLALFSGGLLLPLGLAAPNDQVPIRLSGTKWPLPDDLQKQFKKESHGKSSSASPAHGNWGPPDVDAVVPPVAAGIACPLPQVVQGVSQRVQELVANLQSFSAKEVIQHQEISPNGKPRPVRTRKFDYFVSIEERRPGTLSVEEYRDGSLSLQSFPTSLATAGLPAFALLFHPDYMGDFTIACEGLGQWRGQPTWQLHFQQRADKPVRFRQYEVNKNRYAVKLKGRAWVSADTYEVLRIETDLMEPIPEIELRSEHLAIEYQPVTFQKREIQLWLPESAEMYLDIRGRRYRHEHRFSKYVFFWVDAKQKIGNPKS
jgi:hypothetical protein